MLHTHGMERRLWAGSLALLFLAACGTSQHPGPAADRPVSGGAPTSTPSLVVTSASHPLWDPPDLPIRIRKGLFNCGLAYQVQVSNRVTTLGSCSGLLPKHLFHPLVIARGTVFYVRVGHVTDGSMLYPVPTPDSGVLRLTAQQGFIVQYHAIHPGTVHLVAHGTPYCEGIDPHRGSCPILEVRVRQM